jgi:TctA family transporter
VEEKLNGRSIISDGDPSIFVTRPISALLLACAAAVLVFSVLPAIRRRREEVFVE